MSLNILRVMPWKIIRLGRVDSTQAYAKRLTKSRESINTVIVAKSQSAGKGRRNNIWSSNKGGLYMTLILGFKLNAGLIPLLAGVAIAETINELTELRPCLKWPNDIMIQDKKVAGVLVETIWKGHKSTLILVGIGVNLNNRLPDHLTSASSLLIETGNEVDIDEFLFTLLERLEALLSFLKVDPGEIISRWKELSNTLGREIMLLSDSGEVFRGKVMDVDAEGALLLECNGIIRKILSGTIVRH